MVFPFLDAKSMLQITANLLCFQKARQKIGFANEKEANVFAFRCHNTCKLAGHMKQLCWWEMDTEKRFAQDAYTSFYLEKGGGRY